MNDTELEKALNHLKHAATMYACADALVGKFSSEEAVPKILEELKMQWRNKLLAASINYFEAATHELP